MTLARWQAGIVDDAGNIQGGASVEVRREVTGAPLASIYSDGDGVTPIGTPITPDSECNLSRLVSGLPQQARTQRKSVPSVRIFSFGEAGATSPATSCAPANPLMQRICACSN